MKVSFVFYVNVFMSSIFSHSARVMHTESSRDP